MKIGVIGGGTMGNGIAHVFAQYGNETTLVDVSQEALDRARKTVEKNLGRQLAKEKISQDEMDATLSRLNTSIKLEDLAGSELVIEAIFENLEVKISLLQQVDALLAPEAILASNTSSISITKLAAATSRPDRFIGMHFMNPVPMMRLVEIIRGHETSDETCAKITEIASGLGKTPIECNDSPGFVSNRVLMPMINEAIFTLYEGVAKPEAIDGIMKLGMAHPMGPLTLADFIGLDVCLDILKVLYEGFGDPKYRPCPLLRKMVDAGQLGRKSGRGFYSYDA